MQDKLQILLKQINLQDEYKKYFNNGILERIVGNSAKNHYCFLITLDNILPLEVYKEFISILPNGFPILYNPSRSSHCNTLSRSKASTPGSWAHRLRCINTHKRKLGKLGYKQV